MSSRAVGNSENPGGWAGINPRPFKKKVLFLFLLESGMVIVPSTLRLPTALRILSSSRYSSQGLGYSPGSIATFFSFSGRQLLASSCLNLSLMKEGSNESIQGNIESRPGFIYLPNIVSSDKRLRLAEFREGIPEVLSSGVEKVLVLWIFFIEGQIFYWFSTTSCLLS